MELTCESSANSLRTAYSIVCLENVSEVAFSSSRPDRKHLACDEAITLCERESELENAANGAEGNGAARFVGGNYAVADESGRGSEGWR